MNAPSCSTAAEAAGEGCLRPSKRALTWILDFEVELRSLPVGLKITEKGYLGTILENAGGRQEYILSTMGDKE